VPVSTAFLFIQVELGYEDKVVKRLKEINGVKYAHATYGIYDVVAKIKAETRDKLNELIVNKIRKDKFLGDKIRDTLTQIVVE